MKHSYLFLILLATFRISCAQTAPSGNDNQGSVSAPPGTYSVTPNINQVNAYTGNATRVVDDLYVPSVSSVGLSFIRYNNTRITGGLQWLGVGGNWRYGFQWDFSITAINGAPALQVVYPDGTMNFFTQTSPNVWTSTSAVSDYVVQNGTNYALTNSSNTTYSFAQITTGYILTGITDMRGQTTRMTNYKDSYGFTYPTQITEPGGRYLTLNYTYLQTKKVQTTTSGGHTNAAPAASPNSTNSNSTTIVSYQPYISSVVSSDNRSVTYAYNYQTAQTTQTQPGQTIVTTINSNYLSTATYSDATKASYTYTNLQLSQANDVRALGVPNVKYTYFTGTGVANGDVQTIVEGTGGTTISTISLNGNNPQAPQVTYPDGSLYGYSVNAGGLLSSVQNSLAAFNNFAYASGSGTWTTTSTDANGNVGATTRTVDGKLLTRTWPKVGTETVNPVETWTYNTLGSMITYTDTLNHTTTFTRDPSSNLVTAITYPDSTAEHFTYNAFGEVLTHTRRNGGIEYFTYDSTGLLQTEKDAVGNTTTFAYDTNYRVKTITDALSHATTFLYNDMGKTTQITHPDGTYQSFTYDTIGNLLTKTDELGHTTTLTYDSYRRVLTSKDPLGRTTTYGYDPKTPSNSSPILITLPSGKQVSASYVAGWGYQASSVVTAYGSANPATTSYAYDLNGNVTSVTDPLSHATTFGYDARNRKSWAKDPLGNQAMFNYDDASNLTSQITPDGTSTMVYDAMNRLKQLNDAKNQVSSSTYDAEGKLLTYTDPNSHVYNYGYDLDEHQLSTKYPDTTTQSATYDAAGNVLTATTRDNIIESLSYDNRNRNTGYSFNDGVTPSVSTTYDSASRITAVSNANSALSYTYDNDNEVLSETQNVTGLGSKAVTYTYTTDAVLNTLTYPDSTALTYGYDARNNVTSITQGGSSVVSYTYDANNNRTGKNLANGVTSTLTYDTAERLTSITDLTPSPTSGTLLQKFQYGYDAMSRRTYVKRNNGVGDVYSYDTTDQLTGVQYNCTNPDTTPTSPSQTVAYTYDSAGNRTQVTDSLNGTSSYTPNANNQYTTVGSNTATYNGRGDLTAFGGANYTYDANNKLTSYSDSYANSVTQSYDPLGRCVKRVTNGVASYFVYDLGWRTLADYNSSGTQVNRYVCGPSSNEIVTKTDNLANVYYYHTDGLGSITKLTSSAGAVLEQYSYDVFGKTTISNTSGTVITSSAYNNRFMYTGSEYVSTLNLYNNRNRFYSPSLGRFLQPDPIGHSGDAYNIYRYCGNNPVNAVDPMGTSGVVGISHIGNDGDDYADSWRPGPGSKVNYTNYSLEGLEGYDGGYGDIGESDGVPGSHAVWNGNSYESPDLVSFIGYDTIYINPNSVPPYEDLGDVEVEPTLGELWNNSYPDLTPPSSNSISPLLLVGMGALLFVPGLGEIGDAAIALDVTADAAEGANDTYVIGRLADTAQYAGQDGYQVLNVANWTPELNAAWVQGGIDSGSSFLYASELSEANILSASKCQRLYSVC